MCSLTCIPIFSKSQFFHFLICQIDFSTILKIQDSSSEIIRDGRQTDRLNRPMIHTESGRRRFLYSAVTAYIALPQALREMGPRLFPRNLRKHLLECQNGGKYRCRIVCSCVHECLFPVPTDHFWHTNHNSHVFMDDCTMLIIPTCIHTYIDTCIHFSSPIHSMPLHATKLVKT